jgi:pyruvate/2-oxoglutarate dehydrogenase complex dihydrolipoamide acyltransferase (E2) component
MRQFRLPDLGMGNKDATIVAWHVEEGEEVLSDTRLVSVETEKATVEVFSPFSGRVARLLAKTGDIVKTGAPLAEFAEAAEEEAGAGASRLAITAHKLAQPPPAPADGARQFLMPDLGIGNKDAAVVAWHVAEGDDVLANQQLVSVETEKATIEIPAPWSGRVERLFALAGEQVKVGAPLALLSQSAPAKTATAPLPAAAPVMPAEPRRLARPPRAAPTLAVPASGSPAPITRPSERARAVLDAAAKRQRGSVLPGAGSRVVLAVEIIILLLCGLFLIWWLTALG